MKHSLMPAPMLNVNDSTPTLTVIDPRNLVIRSIGYCRSTIAETADARIDPHSDSGPLCAHRCNLWEPARTLSASRS